MAVKLKIDKKYYLMDNELSQPFDESNLVLFKILRLEIIEIF